jgi:LPXTG-motif cell wall-anchored protein
MKKALLSLALAVALVAMIAAPAFALDLPLNGHAMQQGGQFPEWVTVGTDQNETRGIPVDVFAASRGIRLHVAEEPEGLEMIAFGGGNGWTWTQAAVKGTFADGVLTIRWADNNVNAATLHGEEGVKILIGTWGVQWADQGVTKVELISGGGGPGASGKTGDATMIALALVALTLAAGAAFFVGRKIKA